MKKKTIEMLSKGCFNSIMILKKDEEKIINFLEENNIDFAYSDNPYYLVAENEVIAYNDINSLELDYDELEDVADTIYNNVNLINEYLEEEITEAFSEYM